MISEEADGLWPRVYGQDVGDLTECFHIPDRMLPKNMRKVREYLADCGAIKEST